MDEKPCVFLLLINRLFNREMLMLKIVFIIFIKFLKIFICTGTFSYFCSTQVIQSQHKICVLNMGTNKSKKPANSKKSSAADDFHKPSKMKPLKGKKKSWEDDDNMDEPVLDDDFKGFDDLDSIDDDDDDF